MHFPDSTLPPLPPVTDRTEISPKARSGPTRKVVPGFPESPAEGGGQHPHEHPSEAHPLEPHHDEAVPYAGENRRKICRRIYHIPVLLDTRSGEERRKHGDGGEVPPTHMDVEA